ncbi:MAG: hypothetical protein V4717_10550 [Bacteroidota bacterium]
MHNTLQLVHYCRSANKAGIFLRGDTRCLLSRDINKKAMVIAAINKGPLQVFQTSK